MPLFEVVRYVRCLLCNAHISLQTDASYAYKISNWTRHLKKCNMERSSKQSTLHSLHISAQCEQRGIHVAAFGGDGDSRLMKAMRIATLNSTPPTQEPLLNLVPVSSLRPPEIPLKWKSWFLLKPTPIAFVQDTVYIAVKLKSRLLKPSVMLVMGKYVAGGHHIRMIQHIFGKDQHGLTERDVNHKDKQNFDAVLHIIRASHLLENISDAAGTKLYIKIIECVVEAYLNKSLDPIQRIEKMWFAVLFLRYWRQWLLLHPNYTLANNFITNNAFRCVEFNAHALLTFLLTARSRNIDIFYPWALGSQTCERTFRAARSLTSTFSTITNFSMLSLLRRFHRIEIQFNLQSEMSEEIVFPRCRQNSQKEGNNSYVAHALNHYSNSNIYDAVKRAHLDAKAAMETLGMSDLLTKYDMLDSKEDTHVWVEFDCSGDDDDDHSDDNQDITRNDSSLVKEVCSESSSDIASDIHSLSDCGLLQGEIKDKLNELQKSLVTKKNQFFEATHFSSKL